jgi:hypothetical protein
LKFLKRRTAGLGALVLMAALATTPGAHGSTLTSPKRLAAPSLRPLQRPSTHRSEPFPSTGFRLRASNGYHIFVTGYPKGAVSHHDEVSLFAKTDGAVAGYTVRGEVTSRRIRADIGTLGSIDMRFHRGKGHRHFRVACSSGRYKGKWGAWRGKVDFTGESGYTAVSASHAKPTWLYEPSGCSSVTTGTGIRGVWLDDISAQTFFDAYQNKGRGTRTQFDATEFEASSGMDIIRQVWTHGSPSAFTYNKRLTKATAIPPAPFAGSVDFTRTRHSRKGTLKGDLTAIFPGTGPVSLVGPKNDARIQHAEVTITH